MARDGTPQIFIASDSTAQSYDEARYPQTGWGQMFACALGKGVGLQNRAIGGRSTKSFIAEGRWERLRADLRKGDVVLIQFAHNDANQARPERYAPAETVYRVNLERFVAEARAAGATPVLVTPIAQRMFEADGRTKAGFAAYSAVVRDVARRERVRVIDLESLSRAWIDRTGAERAKAFYLHLKPGDGFKAFPNGITDDTHLSELGARGAAALVAGEYRRLRLPHWQKIDARMPALLRQAPLGHRGCT
ncbi:rhamnogalacturonan acetylesterase [Sphingomonas sp. BT-65]|uniref:rhamnogalacturonan acetylesterase n=1 Tax=Sphingomonas sp. BT-65 TaxID=2989821 RepID=UPI002236A666|nr:rhamnogalacturonan acetylesterase [Sphingomonas sp. BT-65]MCW4462718.1 rhamnogalacturonan acetylesterase [Sphingomonas sp. BT-65]